MSTDAVLGGDTLAAIAAGQSRRLLMLPSSSSPLVVTGVERPLVRYLARHVLWVPPGDSRLRHAVAVAAVHALALPGGWRLAAVAARLQGWQARPGHGRPRRADG